jgi:hypothetical protein
MTKHRPIAIVLAAAALLAGCRAESPEHRAARREARRASCIATELLIQSHDRARTLGGYGGGGALAQVLAASSAYAQAYDEYARTRASQLALADSAINAKSDADSTRFMGDARKLAPAAPQPGTVQASARERYNADFAQAKANPDHPCNKPQEEGDGDGDADDS